MPQPQLEQLLAAIEGGDLRWPPQPAGLMAVGLQALGDRLRLLDGLGRQGACALIRAVLAERRASRGPELTLVWTGPDPLRGGARDTTVIVRELLARAQREVLIGGCYFTNGRDILQPLHTAMLTRGVRVTFCMDVGDAHRDADTPLASAQAAATAFLKENWPFGPPLPDFFFDPRTTERGSMVKLHAKCIVVDGHASLITSANFTYLGQHKNIETGVLIRDAGFATDLTRQWQALIAEGRLIPCPTASGYAPEATVAPESWADAEEFLDAPYLPLVAALIAAGVPGPADYGMELTDSGIALAEISVMHWGQGTKRLSLVAAGVLAASSADVDGQVIEMDMTSDLATLAARVKETLGRLE
ncbi:MAG: DISARM system phospholipase D-like protein DrmC [Myxococcales bacterium]|nr:DISARM system phospholipase D-like protein DrmC [Myxococcales bacterium]